MKSMDMTSKTTSPICGNSLNKLKSKEFIFTFYGSVAEDGVAGSHMDLATRYFGNGEGGWGRLFQ